MFNYKVYAPSRTPTNAGGIIPWRLIQKLKRLGAISYIAIGISYPQLTPEYCHDLFLSSLRAAK